MSDTPTSEEKQFEKDNPQLAAPKELSQWPIRIGLMLLGLVTFWEWGWWKKTFPKLPKDI